MKKIFTIFLFLISFTIVTFASFPIEISQEVITLTDSDPKFDWLGFLLGILFIFLIPYSLLVLPFLFRKNINRVFRKSFGIGALVGLLIAILLTIFIVLAFGGIFEDIFSNW